MKDYQERMVLEQAELRIKLNAIQDYIENSKEFEKRGDYEQLVLTNQEWHMRKYNLALLERIDLF